MATYSHTFTYNIELPEVDTTMTTSIALTCTTAELRQINDYLARARQVVAKRGPFTGEFKGLEEIKGRTLPITETKGMLEIRNHPLDAIPGISALISCICLAVPGIGLNGKIYQVNAYFGKRASYEVVKSPHDKTINLIQHWDDVRPGDTSTPRPKITLSTSSETKADGPAKRTASVVLQTPADVVRSFFERQGEQDEARYEDPKLRLVNGSLIGEPDYLLPDNRFDPMALAWLLQSRLIELDWKIWGTAERTWGIRFNDLTQEKAPTFHANLNNVYGKSPFDVLRYLDSDEFSVPEEWMHPDLVRSGLLPRGVLDLGNTLLLLSAGLWSISQDEADAYRVSCDDRLWTGIPDAPGLVSRLIWMMRAYAGYRNAFSIEFSLSHDASLDERIPVIEHACFGAAGRSGRMVLSITDKPIPDLNGGLREHPFDGGFSNYRSDGLLSINNLKESENLLHDESVFVRVLRDRLASLPLTAKLKGSVFADYSGTERMRLLKGDVLTLASTWGSVAHPIEGDVVEITAYNNEGKCVGLLEDTVELHKLAPTDFGWRELACVLPYITCIVTSVEKGANEVPVTVELMFDARGKSTGSIIHEARQMMREPYELRKRLSRSPLVASDLESNMGVGLKDPSWLRVADEPNPAQNDLEGPQGTRPELCENIIAFAGTESEMAPLMQLMRGNVLKPVSSISGWYHDESELEKATSVEETFRVLRSDFAERLPFVFRAKPSADYFNEKHLLIMERYGDRMALKIWFNTYDKPNNDDLAAFFKSLSVARIPVARMYKRADKREAHVLVDSYAKGKNDFGQMRRKEKVASLEQLRKRYEELDKRGAEKLDSLQLAEWAMLDEALNNLAHKVFTAEQSAEESGAPENGCRPSRYIAGNGKVDAFAIADLLADDVVFFEPDDIAWSKGKHIVKGLRINRSAAGKQPHFVSHARDYAEGIADLLTTLEGSDLLHVKNSDLHHTLCDALGDTDLTGMTLMQLMSWGRAVWIVGDNDGELRESLALRAGVNLAELDAQARERVYVVACDERFLRAVPRAYLLLGRLIGVLRAYNGQSGPHVEVIAAVSSNEAGAYLKDFKGVVSRAACDPFHIEGDLSKLSPGNETPSADHGSAESANQ